MDNLVVEVLKILGTMALAVGIVRGRLNGLVKQVDNHTTDIRELRDDLKEQEEKWATCQARINAEASEKT